MKSQSIKKILAALILLLSPLTMLAEEAYAVRSEDGTTVTFYYDSQRSRRPGISYDIPWEDGSDPGYLQGSGTLTTVIFDQSFAGYHGLTSTSRMFQGLSALTTIEHLEYLNTENVTSMRSMFYNCKKLTYLDVSHFDIAKVTDMYWMFFNCSSLETIFCKKDWHLNLPESSDMFYNCVKLKGDKGTSYSDFHVTASYAHPDGGSDNPGYFSSIEPYAVVSGNRLTFYYDEKKDTRSGTKYDIPWRAGYFPGYTGRDGNPNITTVTFDSSFGNYHGLTSTSRMFTGLSALTTINNLGYLHTENVTDMSYMFVGCSSLTSLDLTAFDTKKVTNMSSMFSGCSALTTIYVGADWSTANVTDGTSMFSGCTNLVGGEGTTYNSRNYGIDYAHIDGGTSHPGYLSAYLEPYALLSTVNSVLTFYYDMHKTEKNNSMDIGSFTSYNDVPWRSSNGTITTVVFDDSFANYHPTSTAYWFYGCNSFTTIQGVENLNTDQVTNMGSMFYNCSKLTSLDLRTFNTKKVTNMSDMFNGCSALTTIYVSDNWSIENVSSGNRTFLDCLNLVGGNGTAYSPSNTTALYARIDKTGQPGYLSVYVEPYAVLSGNRLTFYYDEKRETRSGTKYDIPWLDFPGYSGRDGNSTITTVTFDSSFDNYHGLTSTSRMFTGLSALTTINNLGYLHTENVTDMNAMFTRCSSLTSLDLTTFDTKKVTDMSYMFNGCSALTTIYAGADWSTANVTSGTNMFSGCSNLKGGNGTAYNGRLTGITYARIDMPGQPGYLTDKNATTEAYAVLSADNTTLTFYYDTHKDARNGMSIVPFTNISPYPGLIAPNTPWFSQTGTITTVVFDESFAGYHPTSTAYWFYYCLHVTTIEGIENLKTDKVTDMRYMFSICGGLTSLDLSNFNTANVTNMYFMFAQSNNLKTIYVGDGWSTGKVTDGTYMFANCTSLVGGSGTTYDADHIDYTYAHIDGGTSNPGYLSSKNTTKETYAALDGTTLTFYYDTQRNTHGTTYNLYSGNTTPGWYSDNNYKTVTKVVFDASFKDARPTSTYRWLDGMSSLTSISGMKENLNTSEVTDMRFMFRNCSNLTTLDVSGFNTSNVTDMSDMFFGCSSLTTLDVSGFNTAKVTDMSYMFCACPSLTSLVVSGFNTSNVTNMNSMFRDCSSLTSLNVSTFNTGKVTNMGSMFYNCSKLTSLDLSNFNTANVTSMWGMFCSCSGLTSLDLTNFNTKKVTEMSWMFRDCSGLKTIYVGDEWSTERVTSGTNMFFNCTSLVGGSGTRFDAGYVDHARAHIDGGTSNPGYLSRKLDFVMGDANGDGKVTITDAVAVVNYILNTTPGTFNVAAADVDGNGEITIADAVRIVNLILNGSVMP